MLWGLTGAGKRGTVPNGSAGLLEGSNGDEPDFGWHFVVHFGLENGLEVPRAHVGRALLAEPGQELAERGFVGEVFGSGLGGLRVQATDEEQALLGGHTGEHGDEGVLLVSGLFAGAIIDDVFRGFAGEGTAVDDGALAFAGAGGELERGVGEEWVEPAVGFVVAEEDEVAAAEVFPGEEAALGGFEGDVEAGEQGGELDPGDGFAELGLVDGGGEIEGSSGREGERIAIELFVFGVDAVAFGQCVSGEGVFEMFDDGGHGAAEAEEDGASGLAPGAPDFEGGGAGGGGGGGIEAGAREDASEEESDCGGGEEEAREGEARGERVRDGRGGGVFGKGCGGCFGDGQTAEHGDVAADGKFDANGVGAAFGGVELVELLTEGVGLAADDGIFVGRVVGAPEEDL